MQKRWKVAVVGLDRRRTDFEACGYGIKILVGNIMLPRSAKRVGDDLTRGYLRGAHKTDNEDVGAGVGASLKG